MSQDAVLGFGPFIPATGRKLLQGSRHFPSEITSRGVGGIRRLLQISNTVPVTIDASDYQQVLQSLGNISSGGNLTTALREAGRPREMVASLNFRFVRERHLTIHDGYHYGLQHVQASISHDSETTNLVTFELHSIFIFKIFKKVKLQIEIYVPSKKNLLHFELSFSVLFYYLPCCHL